VIQLSEAGDIAELIVAEAPAWDLDGRLPVGLLRDLGKRGLLCAQVPEAYGGRGWTSRRGGEFTAAVGELCSSVRSVMTSQGMAAWTVQRMGDRAQRQWLLGRLTGGELAAVGFSEADAGSDLSAIRTQIRSEGDHVVVDGAKVWTTAAAYADLLVIVGRYGDAAAAVVVPADAPGVVVERVRDPLGCRAAGHANVRLDRVRLPAGHLLGGGGQPLALLVTTALAYGRLSVAWGCVGIQRACLAAATTHAREREQSGVPLARHQLVARHLAELYAGEQISTRVCEHASDCWDARSPEQVTATVLAKYVSAGRAVRGAETAVQVLASAAARDGHVVARAYRDAKLMEIIEGSTEICQLILSESIVGERR
jgi:methoxymalonate biosynthesis protein